MQPAVIFLCHFRNGIIATCSFYFAVSDIVSWVVQVICMNLSKVLRGSSIEMMEYNMEKTNATLKLLYGNMRKLHLLQYKVYIIVVCLLTTGSGLETSSSSSTKYFE